MNAMTNDNLQSALSATVDQRDQLSAEMQEQARIIGISGEREARLLARVEELKRENEALRRNLEASTARLNESLYQRSRLQSQIDALNKAADDMTLAFDRQFSASEEMAGRLLLADEENEALRNDAERYRWLKDNPSVEYGVRYEEEGPVFDVFRITGPVNDREWENIGTGTPLDAAIDAAMKGQ